MNQRIDELAQQAGIFKPKEFYQHIDALQLEKFAELIVRECATLAFDGPNGILEHFGVDE